LGFSSRETAGGRYAAGFLERTVSFSWFRRFVSESIDLDG
jgi:hypothetical protein